MTEDDTPGSARSDKRDDGKSDDGASKSGNGESSSSAAATTSGMIHMRCLIVTQDASIIIGKAGAHVNEIREKSGAKVMVSESIPGNPERILNVSGPLDAVSKVRRPVYVVILPVHGFSTGIWPHRQTNQR